MLLHKRVNVDLLWLLISYLKLVEELLQRIFTLVANLSEVKNQVTEVEGWLVVFSSFYSIRSNVLPPHPASKQCLRVVSEEGN